MISRLWKSHLSQCDMTDVITRCLGPLRVSRWDHPRSRDKSTAFLWSRQKIRRIRRILHHSNQRAFSFWTFQSNWKWRNLCLSVVPLSEELLRWSTSHLVDVSRGIQIGGHGSDSVTYKTMCTDFSRLLLGLLSLCWPGGGGGGGGTDGHKWTLHQQQTH